MSKKAERVKRSFARQWFAVISGSMFAVSVQSAQAAQQDRMTLREFRNDHANLSRHEAKQMFRQEHRGHRFNTAHAANNAASGGGITAVVPQIFVMWVDKNGVVHCGNPPKNLLQNHNLHNQSVQTNLDGSVVRLNNGVDLDLSAAEANITLGNNLFKQADSVTIYVGGETKTVGAGAQVTSAEYVAVKQVLGGGVQKISVDASGKAIGGEFDLNSISAAKDVMKASSLVIPENVTSYGQFGRGSEFRLVGDLDNYGSLIASSNNRRGSTIHADDITNHSGASIASVKNDLNLIADGSLTNDGSISSAANLTLSSSSIRNSGTVSATSGSITLDGPEAAALSVNNTGGTMSAQTISLRNSDYQGSFDTNLTGGDLLSKQFNINSGTGMTEVDVNQLTGTLNQKGLGVHVKAATENLTIGNTCLTGDPTYYNTAGDITIVGNITVAEALTIITQDDIISANNITITATSAASGFPITLIAGVDITFLGGGADQATLGPIPPPNANNGAVKAALGSTQGGSVLLGQSNVINTRPTGATGGGGSVSIIAFSGANAGSGTVDLSGTTISTGGKGTGNNGGVEIIAGAANTTIGLNTINTTGGSGTGGGVSISAAQPAISVGTEVIYNSAGVLSSPGFYIPGNTRAANTVITLPSITMGDGGLQIIADGTVNLFNPTTVSGDSASIDTNGSVFISGNLNLLNSLQLFADGNFTQTSASTISVTNAGSSATVNVGGNITNGANSVFNAATVQLNSSNGRIGTNAGSRFKLDADNILVGAPSGNAFITDVDAVNFTINNTVGGTLDVIAGGAITSNGPISADIIKMNAKGAMTFNSSVTAGTSALLHATSGITGSGLISAGTLTLQTDTGDVGAGVTPLNINADNLVVFAAAGSASLNETDIVNFGGGNTFVGKSLIILADIAITSSSLITAGDSLGLIADTLNIAAPISASNAITLASTNDLLNTNVTGNLSTNTLFLSSFNGNVGTSGSPFLLNGATNIHASRLAILTNALDANISNLSATPFELATSTTKGALNFSTLGSLTISGKIDSQSTINISTSSGTLKINNAVQITAKDNISISNVGTNKVNDKFIIEDGVGIITATPKTGAGDVTLVLGTNTGNAKKTVKNAVIVQAGGGTVRVKNKGVKVTLSTPTKTTFTGQGADLVIANSINNKNFTIGGNVVITADPPIPEGSLVTIIDGNAKRNNIDVQAALNISAPLRSSDTTNVLQISAASNTAPVSRELNSSTFNLLATLPATVNGAGFADTDIDDSFITTSSPTNRGLNARLLGHKAFNSAANAGTTPVVDELIGEVHTMNNDSAVVVASRDTTVVSPNGNVKVAAGAVVYITSTSGQLSVYDLDDKHKGSVVVETSGRQIALSPGRHITITRSGAEQYADINQAEAIAHRLMSRQLLNAENVMFQSEFSLPSAISAIKPLSSLVESKHSEAKKITERLLKTTAVLMQIGGSTPYTSHAKTRTVALNR